MRLLIRCEHFKLSEAIQEQVRWRLRMALRRFGHRIRDIAANLADLNGPRGGADKQCRLVVRLRPSGMVMVQETDRHVLSATALAASRIKRAVIRALQRQRDAKIDPNGFSPRLTGRQQ
jgi:putative sigma-54 modulation protein